MCHHYTRERISQDDRAEREELDEPVEVNDPILPLSAEDEPAEGIELLTDGGDR